MKIVIDSANVDTIKKLIDYYPIVGVTTNPSIIVKEKRPFLPLLKEIRSIIGDERMLHVQVLSSTATEMVEESINNREQLGGNYYTKIPVTREGIKAIKELKLKGIKVLATTIYTPMQAIVAANAGANYVAPYVNRIENLSGNGIQVVEEIRTMFDQYNLSCKILAASFKNVRQVQGVCLAGAHAITAGGDIIESLLNHPSTQGDVEQFQEDWKSFYREE
jgi:fructose-6-phosphate aldolase 2